MSARLLVRDEATVVERPPEQLSELRDKPCWIDIPDRSSGELVRVAKALDLHPLAVEDATQRDERPKIDQYESHYFIVFYAVDSPSPDVVNYHEFSIFVVQNALVTVHDGECEALKQVEKRFREGRLKTTGQLLHALLDTMVDGYFAVVDHFGDRIELLEEFIEAELDDSKGMHAPLKELFLVKRDLLQLRKTIAPERDVLQVLIRGDIRELREAGRRAYFQDVYDHVIRVTDEIDTFRELTSNVIDAYLAAASNRLNQVMKVLTSIATILLVLTLFTGFFGMNFKDLPFDNTEVFLGGMALMIACAGLVAWFFKRRGWL
jgi:magnesium transporter